MSSYTALEPDNLTSFGGAVPAFNANASLFSTSLFIYTLFFVVITMVAFYRYVIAGALRMQASESGITQSNEIIKRVTLGLVGTFSLFLILFTVNKGLVTGDVQLNNLRADRAAGYDGPRPDLPTAPPVTQPGVGGQAPASGGGVWWEAIREDPIIRSNLAANNISVNKPACPNPSVTNCTTVGGWLPETVAMLKSLRSTCGGRLEVTGGTEAGHSSHGPGKSPVDISMRDDILNSCIRSFSQGPTLSFCRATYTSFGYTFCDERGSHWHVFKR